MMFANHIYGKSHIYCSARICRLERLVLTPIYDGTAATAGVINFYLCSEETKQNFLRHLPNYTLFKAMKPLHKAWLYITAMIKALMKLLHNRSHRTIEKKLQKQINAQL